MIEEKHAYRRRETHDTCAAMGYREITRESQILRKEASDNVTTTYVTWRARCMPASPCTSMRGCYGEMNKNTLVLGNPCARPILPTVWTSECVRLHRAHLHSSRNRNFALTFITLPTRIVSLRRQRTSSVPRIHFENSLRQTFGRSSTISSSCIRQIYTP